MIKNLWIPGKISLRLEGCFLFSYILWLTFCFSIEWSKTWIILYNSFWWVFFVYAFCFHISVGYCFNKSYALFFEILRLGPPDFHPQTPNCPEETLTREYVQSGYKETVEGLEVSLSMNLFPIKIAYLLQTFVDNWISIPCHSYLDCHILNGMLSI